MAWYERMNMAIDYIEENLCNDINFEMISKITCQSPVSFQRTFSIVTDISVFEYIRRRKLTLAAFDLQNSNVKVIDVALKYGYESPEAFTRAFKETHGTTPSKARKYGLPLKAFPRITFLLSLKGDSAMEYRIENKEAFTVYGIEGIFTMEDGKNLKDVGAFWRECLESKRLEKLIESANEPRSCIYAVGDYRRTPDGDSSHSFPYMISVCRTENCNTSGYVEVEIPAATWAVFRSENYYTREQAIGMIREQAGTSALHNFIKRIYTDWLPTAAYNKIHGYEMELYFISDINKCYPEIWIRVEPK